MKKNLRKFLIAVFFIVIILKFALSVFAEDILIKKPNVSGAFYPGDAADLSTMIKSFFDNVSEAYTEEKVCALISPHAGYIYSGQAAAYGYKKASKFKYKTIIILSPTHYFKFNKAAVFKGDFFKTPLGDVPLDNDFIEELIKQDKDIIELNSVFEKEHALE
ncbi:MAG: AmmeMemoRadiSam system protein B, partial [Candidatus Omnitrophica bacterium]|nr:AmmeMemoRadiSam system protein B [Candidatus Omnitrophota bacterium]